MALPMTLIIISGEIDLSVASILGMSSALLGVLWSHHWPMLAIFVVVALLGIVAGLINGLLVTRVGLPSLAVTIGTLALYRGVALILLGANTVSDFPATYTNIGVLPLPHTQIPWNIAIFAVLAVIFGIVLHATATGRSLYAMGASPRPRCSPGSGSSGSRPCCSSCPALSVPCAGCCGRSAWPPRCRTTGSGSSWP